MEEEIYQSTVAWIRANASIAMEGTSISDKLRLYALHKHIENGPCARVPPPPYKVQAYAKYSAYKACESLSRDEARREFMTIAASQKTCLGQRLRDYVEGMRFHDDEHEDCMSQTSLPIDLSLSLDGEEGIEVSARLGQCGDIRRIIIH